MYGDLFCSLYALENINDVYFLKNVSENTRGEGLRTSIIFKQHHFHYDVGLCLLCPMNQLVRTNPKLMKMNNSEKIIQ